MKTPLEYYDDGVRLPKFADGNGLHEYAGLLARTCVTGGFRSGTLVLASIVLLFLFSVLPAASTAMLWNA